MEMTLNMGAFEEMNACEMMEIDGGFTWRGLAGSMVAGGVTGGLGGAAIGGIGAAPGAVGGALLGGIAYCIADIIGE